MIERSGRTFLFSLALSISLAAESFAGAIDPIPLYKTAAAPPERRRSSEASALFLCPQTKHFGNPSEKVAVETLMLEALGEGFGGMVAVGEVIRNRTRLFSKDAEAVCLMPKQFSCWNDPERAEAFLERYRHFHFAARIAWMASEHTALTQGATDYHTRSVSPYWARAYRVAARIGAHVFYVRERAV